MAARPPLVSEAMRWAGLRLAVTLLTAIPLRGRGPAPTRGSARTAMTWAPVIGLLLGGAAAGVIELAALRWPGGFRETFRGSGSLAGDAAVAGADKGDQMQGLRRGDFAFDARQRFFQLQAGTVEIAVGLLEDADLGRLVSGAFEAD